jgi:hypothetical protein
MNRFLFLYGFFQARNAYGYFDAGGIFLAPLAGFAEQVGGVIVDYGPESLLSILIRHTYNIKENYNKFKQLKKA